MENTTGHHISRQFDEDLEQLRSMVLTMGGVVEEQISDAIEAFVNADRELAEKVSERDHEVNGMEVALDEECSRIQCSLMGPSLPRRMTVLATRSA